MLFLYVLDNRIKLPLDLQDLYQLYQQEIHASTYNESSPDKLPPIKGQVSRKLEYIFCDLVYFSDARYYRRLLNAGSSPDSDGEGTRLSSAESDLDLSPLPHVMPESSVDRVMGHHVTRPGATLRFPPVSRSIRTNLPGTRYFFSSFFVNNNNIDS